MRKQILVEPGQKVIGTDGKTHTVAFTRNGVVWAYSLLGLPVPISVVYDAWGGEFDQLANVA